MKKKLYIIMLISVLALTGYGKTQESDTTQPTTSVEANEASTEFTQANDIESGEELYPPEFLMLDETWGVTLTAENVTPTNLTLICAQSGGEATGELQTGSRYIVEKWIQENGWKELSPQCEVGWDDIAYILPKDERIEWEINWERIYGKLPEGRYRIGKEIMDFRKTGDYDTAIYYAEFEITK